MENHTLGSAVPAEGLKNYIHNLTSRHRKSINGRCANRAAVSARRMPDSARWRFARPRADHKVNGPRWPRTAEAELSRAVLQLSISPRPRRSRGPHISAQTHRVRFQNTSKTKSNDAIWSYGHLYWKRYQALNMKLRIKLSLSVFSPTKLRYLQPGDRCLEMDGACVKSSGWTIGAPASRVTASTPADVSFKNTRINQYI